MHAGGPATRTPERLEALESDDVAVLEQVEDHLYNTLAHQGQIYPATVPTVAWLCERLTAGRYAAGPEVLGESREALLLRFVSDTFRWAREYGAIETPSAAVQSRLERVLDDYDGHTLWNDNELCHALTAGAVLDLRRFGPASAATGLAIVDSADADVVVHALDLIAYAGLADPGAVPSDVAETLYRFADRRPERVRATAVAALGRLGLDVTAFLGDDAAEVRLQAALGVGLERDPQGARGAPRSRAALAGRPGVRGRPRRSPERLCAAARDFDEVLDVALALAPTASRVVPERDWGVFLLAAQRLHPDGPTLSVRTYLAALVERDELWDPYLVNSTHAFERAGLPADREACARIAAGG